MYVPKQVEVESTPEHAVTVTTDATDLQGDLALPIDAHGVVLFAHGSGSSRFSSRNRLVAGVLQQCGFATLLLDLLTGPEEVVDQHSRQFRFDIPLLANRLSGAVGWLQAQPATERLPIGLFGASTGAAAALITAADHPDAIRTVISRGGRPDLAGDALQRVQAPTLLIVGGRDEQVIDLNTHAQAQIRAYTELTIVPGATHLFEEPGALETVSSLACSWFSANLA